MLVVVLAVDLLLLIGHGVVFVKSLLGGDTQQEAEAQAVRAASLSLLAPYWGIHVSALTYWIDTCTG